MKLVPTYPVPDRMPNGLQWTDKGLFVMDQYSDNVYVLGDGGRVVRTITTPTENGSGITVGGGYLWTASTGTTKTRGYRPTDTHVPWVYKLDLETGAVVDRYATPDGGGIHGIEWDDGLLWLTAFKPRALVLVDLTDFTVVKKLPSDLEVPHGLARDGNGIWCADRKAKIIVKYDVETGAELDRITFPADAPDPHALSIKDGELWYCDAAFPEPRTRDLPEIGKVVRQTAVVGSGGPTGA